MSIRNMISDRVKQALDRRYVPRDQMASTVHMEARLRVQGDNMTLARMSSLEERLDRLEDLYSEVRVGADFIHHEDPHDLRKRLFTAHRLANECAIAIEMLLQADILHQRDLDELAASR
ncbi:MAG: hypothetical protein WBM90_10670 [Acidimicrobiia bacterium]